ncbi:hypothetical protein 035JT004_86 [Bacillus phage 035JT004]|nr:hypothetical protein 035JT004_86 [Bacillus phage 035JT004]
MVEKVVIEITGEKAILKLLGGDGKELNRAVTEPGDGGLITTHVKGAFDEMDEDVLPEELLEALESGFYVEEILWALEEMH